MFVQRDGKTIAVSYYANEEQVYSNGDKPIKVKIEAGSKREDFEDKYGEKEPDKSKKWEFSYNPDYALFKK